MGKITKKDLNFQIGFLVGETIVDKYLPTLSTDMIHSNNIIEVPAELYNEWHEMDIKHNETRRFVDGILTSDTELFYKNREWYKKNIEDVYLEDELKIHMQFYYSDKETVMEGIESALWDCDLSHYRLGSLEEHKMTNEIILIRDRGQWKKDQR